jgi:hypothetical protein
MPRRLLAAKIIVIIKITAFFAGERLLYKDGDVSVPTGLSLNGRIFVSPKEHQDALVRQANQF